MLATAQLAANSTSPSRPRRGQTSAQEPPADLLGPVPLHLLPQLRPQLRDDGEPAGAGGAAVQAGCSPTGDGLLQREQLGPLLEIRPGRRGEGPPLLWAVLWVLQVLLPSGVDVLSVLSQTVFNVIDKSTGKVLPTRFYGDALVVFHHINAYEEEGHLVLDLIAYDNSHLYDMFYLHNLRNADFSRSNSSFTPPTCRRFVLPLHTNKVHRPLPRSEVRVKIPNRI